MLGRVYVCASQGAKTVSRKLGGALYYSSFPGFTVPSFQSLESSVLAILEY
jgi:hypothetical protein